MIPLKLHYSLLIFSSLKVILASPLHHEATPTAPLYIPPTPLEDHVNNSYIVMFKDGITPQAFATHLDFVSFVKEAVPLQSSEEGLSVETEHVYNSDVGKGYSGRFSPEAIELIRRRPEVDFVEQDQVEYADAVQSGAPWGLARISQKKLGPMRYSYPVDTGKGVVVYVIDSGVNIKHREFEGRAMWGKSFIPSEGNTDYKGHGTHVAGTVASRKYGVAKKAQIISVKVLDKRGSGAVSASIAALDWIAKDVKVRARASGFKGAVVNMSLGGGPSPAKERAVNNAVKAGLHIAVAAGNDHKDACTHSPARATLPITVGSVTVSDKLGHTSNHGKCVDILAPGVQIVSTGHENNSQERKLSGTSMATPHVAGLIAHFLSVYPSRTFNPFSSSILNAVNGALPGYISDLLTSAFEESDSDLRTIAPATMKRALQRIAWKGMISNLPRGTPNMLAFNNYTVYRRFDLWDDSEGLFELFDNNYPEEDLNDDLICRC